MYPIGAFRPIFPYCCELWAPSSTGKEVPSSDFLGPALSVRLPLLPNSRSVDSRLFVTELFFLRLTRSCSSQSRQQLRGLIMSDNCYVSLGLGVIVAWFFSAVATFLILAIMHVGKRK
jgi:hypothetical protein